MNIKSCKEFSEQIFVTVGPAIGIHVLLLVMEHAVWKTKGKYEEAALIEYSEAGISLDKLDAIDSKKADLVASEFVMSIIATLGRLVGKQLASQLTEQIKCEIDKEEG